MTHNNSHYQAHQFKRWMRPDAHRFVRPTGCTLSGPASGVGIGRGGGQLGGRTRYEGPIGRGERAQRQDRWLRQHAADYPYYVIAIGLIAELYRRRTATKDS